MDQKVIATFEAYYCRQTFGQVIDDTTIHAISLGKLWKKYDGAHSGSNRVTCLRYNRTFYCVVQITLHKLNQTQMDF